MRPKDNPQRPVAVKRGVARGRLHVGWSGRDNDGRRQGGGVGGRGAATVAGRGGVGCLGRGRGRLGGGAFRGGWAREGDETETHGEPGRHNRIGTTEQPPENRRGGAPLFETNRNLNATTPFFYRFRKTTRPRNTSRKIWAPLFVMAILT